MNFKKIFFALAILATILLTAGVAWAPPLPGPVTYTICAAGCNSTTINGGIALAGAGDTVHVTDDAVYNEQVNMTDGVTLDCDGATINSSTNYGIYLNSVDNSTAKNCYVNVTGTSTLRALYLSNSDNNTFSSITVGDLTSSSSVYGIYLNSADNNTFNTTELGTLNSTSNNAYGIYLTNNADYNTLVDTTLGDLEGNSVYGIWLNAASPSTNTEITSTVIGNMKGRSNAAYGIRLGDLDTLNTIHDLQIGDIWARYDAYGIYGYNDINNELSSIVIGDISGNGDTSGYGIRLYNSDNDTLEDITIGAVIGNTTNAYGVYIRNTDNAVFRDITISDVSAINGGSTAYGLRIYQSTFNEFDTVTIGDVYAEAGAPSAYGMYLHSSSNNNSLNKVTVGDIFGNMTSAYGIRISCANGNDFTTTRVGNVESTTSTANGLYMECADSPDYNTLTNTQIGNIVSGSNDAYGIRILEESGHNTLNNFQTGNLDAGNDAYGMYLRNLDAGHSADVNYFNTITLGSITASDYAYGLYIYNSDNQEIDGFTAGVLTGGDTTYAAYFLNSESNTLKNSKLRNADIGLYLGEVHSSVNNTIENNVIMDNSEWNMVNDQASNVSAENNCWGLTNAAAIDATIKDDDETTPPAPTGIMSLVAVGYGEVDFQPFDTSCVESGARYDELPWSGGGGGTTPSPYKFTIDLDLLKEYGFKLAVGESGRILIDGVWHTVTVLEIGDGYAVIEIRSEAQSATILVGKSETFDTDGDSMNDLKVTLDEISNDKANLKLESIEEVEPVAYEPIAEPISEKPVEEEPEEDITIDAPAKETTPTDASAERAMWPFLLIVGIVVVVVAAILIKGCPMCNTGKKKKK